MKKLERLKINQLQEFTRVGDEEQMMLKGGFFIMDAGEYAWKKQVGDEINEFRYWWSSLKSDAKEFVKASIPLGITTLEEAATHLLNKFGNTNFTFLIAPDERFLPGYESDPNSQYNGYV